LSLLRLLTPSGIPKSAPSLLEPRRCLGEVAVRLDLPGSSLELVAEPFERVLRDVGLAPGDRLSRVSKCLRCGPTDLCGGRLQPRKRRRCLGPLLCRHRANPIGELREVLGGRLRIAVRVRFRAACRRS
jgi:hypothetical protein